MIEEACVLSIQSHVVHGCVGNKAAVFPLQLHGLEVSPINVVQLSNHTGYKIFRGTRMTADEFQLVVEGLQANQLLYYPYTLVGYVGNASLLKQVCGFVRDSKLPDKTERKQLVFLDPVCGDNGKLYVPQDVPQIYREEFIRLADVVSPNGFEASVLSGIEITGLPTAIEAAEWFHRRGVRLVCIKSFFDEQTDKEHKRILCLVSNATCEDSDGGDVACSRVRVLFEVDRKDYYFSGTGDLFSALVVAKIHEVGGLTALKDSAVTENVFGKVIGSVQDVLAHTHAFYATGSRSAEGQVERVKELRLVAAAKSLSTPSTLVRGKHLL